MDDKLYGSMSGVQSDIEGEATIPHELHKAPY